MMNPEIDSYNMVMAVIALVSSLIALVALYDTRKRYKDSMKPVITFRYTYQENGLILAVRNEGKSPVQSFTLKLLEINGYHPRYPTGEGDLMSGKMFDLYPGDIVSNQIGLFPWSGDYAVPPSDITIQFSYRYDGQDYSATRTVGLFNDNWVTYVYRSRVWFNRSFGPVGAGIRCLHDGHIEKGQVPGRPDGHPPLHRGEGQEAGGAGRGDQREWPTAAGPEVCQRRTPMHHRWLKNI